MIGNLTSFLLSSMIMIIFTICIKKRSEHHDKIILYFQILGYILLGILIIITIIEATVFQDFYASNYRIVRIVDNTVFFVLLFDIVIISIINIKKIVNKKK